MTSQAEKILADALALPSKAREELIAALATSLEPITLDPAWQAEVARRLAAMERGDATLHDAQAHLQSVRAKLPR